MRPSFRAGFTLIEVLVVVTIIGIMAGLLLPAIQQSRAASRRMTCQSNLRQWTIAVLRYADDHQGDLPRRGQGMQRAERFDRMEDWFNALPPYLESTPLVRTLTTPVQGVWVCPEFVGETPPRFLYGMNMWLSTWHSPTPDNLKKVGALSSMVFMADGPGEFCALLPSRESYSPVARHTGVVNVAFLDGHVAAIDGDEAGCGTGLQHRDDVRWKPPDSPWEGPHVH